MVKGKKILITGGTGFIGSWLTELLCQDNDVTLFDNGRRNAFRFLPIEVQKKVKVVKGDIRSKQSVKKVVKDQNIVLHLAAIAGASSYERNPLATIDVNLFGSVNLFEALVGSDVEQLVDFSSSEVYGPFADNVTEDGTTNVGPASEGRWSYAISKLASEHIAHGYYKKNKLPIVTVRPFNVYGPRQVGEGAVMNMIKTSLLEGKIYVSGDGKQGRAWCYVEDFIKGIYLICDKKIVGETFNIGNSDTHVSMSQLARLIQKIDGRAEIVPTKGVKSEIYRRLPNTKKAEKILGFKAKIGLEEALLKTYQWYKAHLGEISSRS